MLIRRLLPTMLAAALTAGAATADAADAPGRPGGLEQYIAPADYLVYIEPKGAYRPEPCPDVPARISTFGYNGAPLGDAGAATGTIPPYKTLWHGQGGVVVWNGHTRRWRNYTDQPVLVAGWCARVTG